jgi:hypothetical protein
MDKERSILQNENARLKERELEDKLLPQRTKSRTELALEDSVKRHKDAVETLADKIIKQMSSGTPTVEFKTDRRMMSPISPGEQERTQAATPPDNEASQRTPRRSEERVRIKTPTSGKDDISMERIEYPHWEEYNRLREPGLLRLAKRYDIEYPANVLASPMKMKNYLRSIWEDKSKSE